MVKRTFLKISVLHNSGLNKPWFRSDLCNGGNISQRQECCFVDMTLYK